MYFVYTYVWTGARTFYAHRIVVSLSLIVVNMLPVA